MQNQRPQGIDLADHLGCHHAVDLYFLVGLDFGNKAQTESIVYTTDLKSTVDPIVVS